ncbi:hypothetical protein HDU93_008415 [Gonapodya sp. JEL0774]|nr:hypothetical protein HDU93_008415 [Gonapodya sp. JEL0774]
MAGLFLTDPFAAPIDPSQLTWSNPPETWSVDTQSKSLKLVTDKGTDFWQRTHYNFQHDNGHFLHFSPPANRDYLMTVGVRWHPKSQYDQAGILIRASPSCWLKSCIEFESPTEHARIGAVATNSGFSDWSTFDYDNSVREGFYRVERKGGDYTGGLGSAAWGIAKACRNQGAEVATTFLNAKAEKFVRPLYEQIQSPIILPCDVTHEGELEAVFAAVKDAWGKLDFVMHSLAYAPKEDLMGRVVDSSAKGFLYAMDVSCHSLIRMTKLAEPLMADGGCIITLTHYGSTAVHKNYGIMGPVKYLAVELGPKRIRVNAVSPGGIATHAASGIPGFAESHQQYKDKLPMPVAADQDDVGAMAVFLISEAGRAVTGGSTLWMQGRFLCDSRLPCVGGVRTHRGRS